MPAPTSTSMPAPTNRSIPPKPTNTPNAPKPTNTPKEPKPTHTPKEPKPTHTPKAPKPTHTPKPHNNNEKLSVCVTVDEFRGKLLPAIADRLNQIIKTDKAANTLLQVFDSDHNGTITVQELENNTLLMLAISLDLDLLDTSGKFNPGQDGVKYSYSIGLGFTCVPATFAAPGD